MSLNPHVGFLLPFFTVSPKYVGLLVTVTQGFFLPNKDNL